MDIVTDHGHYDVLRVRESDNPPAPAITHAVFHESGELAGFASRGMAWSADGRPLGGAGSLDEAAALVADGDPARG